MIRICAIGLMVVKKWIVQLFKSHRGAGTVTAI
jgi:hypothetical protein